SYHTIKQIGGHMSGTANGHGTTLRVHGIPAFQAGEKYVVFLPERSALGFSSPLGLHQGSFSVRTIDNQQVVNNAGMAEPAASGTNSQQLPLAVDIEKPSQSYLSDFINTVRAYNAQ
ncbi:MAG: hypothetical protein IMF14_09330, partial [Proteobacteria bacterium]|nr:hypothetical protein [Pseudomonadota bacterium]